MNKSRLFVIIMFYIIMFNNLIIKITEFSHLDKLNFAHNRLMSSPAARHPWREVFSIQFPTRDIPPLI